MYLLDVPARYDSGSQQEFVEAFPGGVDSESIRALRRAVSPPESRRSRAPGLWLTSMGQSGFVGSRRGVVARVEAEMLT